MSLKWTVWLCVFGLAFSPLVWAQNHASNTPEHASHHMPNATAQPPAKTKPQGERVYRSKKLRIHKHPHGSERGKRGHRAFQRSERQSMPPSMND